MTTGTFFHHTNMTSKVTLTHRQELCETEEHAGSFCTNAPGKGR